MEEIDLQLLKAEEILELFKGRLVKFRFGERISK
jgi:hypothetical protein